MIRANTSSLEESRARRVTAIASFKGKTVAASTGYLFDLDAYQSKESLVICADGIDGIAYEGVEFLVTRRLLGSSSSHLLVGQVTKVLPQHRNRGLGKATNQMCLDLCASKAVGLYVLVQPFPIEIDAVEPEETAGRSVMSRTAYERVLKCLIAYWSRSYPFLRAVGIGGLDKDRYYLFGSRD